jgi:hypothetical protein
VAPVAPIAAGRRRPTAPTTRTELRRGGAAAIPLVVGYAPFALVVGSAIGEHANPTAGWAAIWLVISGSALLSTITALDSGPALVAVLTGILVNARLAVYSASLRRAWADQPAGSARSPRCCSSTRPGRSPIVEPELPGPTPTAGPTTWAPRPP